MQEQKITLSPYYLVLQTTYETVEIGLFGALSLLDSIVLDKKQASRNLIPDLNTLLRNNTLSLEQIDFFAVNQGPGPFTSLRVVITTANGLSFATKKPLIGLNGLEQFLDEFNDPQWAHTVALLNAYHNDVYFAFEEQGKCTETGALSISALLDTLKQYPQPVRLIGNGVDLYKKEIVAALKDSVFLPETMPQFVSLQQLGKAAYTRWQKKEDLTKQLLPLYLKTQQYQKSIV